MTIQFRHTNDASDYRVVSKFLVAIQFGLEGCGLVDLIALVHPENLASRRVVEKCGLGYQETLHVWGSDLMRHRLERP